MRVKCLAQEHNTMSPAGAGTRTARSGYNHEVTDFQGVVLDSTGAEVQNERNEREGGEGEGEGEGMISAKKTKRHHCYLTNFKDLLILTT